MSTPANPADPDGDYLKSEEAREADLEAVADGALYEYAHKPGARPPVNVARIMREGVVPPEMALDEWLVKGELHWVYADAESAKTWLALVLAIEVMKTGGVVGWFDEELGAAVIAERMLALGADPATIEQQFAYFPFPSWQVKDAEGARDRELHRTLLAALKPALRLVVYDTATDALSEARLDENYGIDVTTWVKAYPEQARSVGAAQLVLDHTTKDGAVGKHAVGSRAKRAKAKVQYAMRTPARFDRTTVGRVTVEMTKNTRGATIPVMRDFRAGGDGQGGFIWELMNSLQTAADAVDHGAIARDRERVEQIETAVKDQGPLTQNKVKQFVKGRNQDVNRLLQELVNSPSSGVTLGNGPRNSLVYSWVEQPNDNA